MNNKRARGMVCFIQTYLKTPEGWRQTEANDSVHSPMAYFLLYSSSSIILDGDDARRETIRGKSSPCQGRMSINKPLRCFLLHQSFCQRYSQICIQNTMISSSCAVTPQSMRLSPSMVGRTRPRSLPHNHTSTSLTRAMHSTHEDSGDVEHSRRQALLALSTSMLVLPGLVGRGVAEEPVTNAYDFDLEYRGDAFPLDRYKNKVTVFVNVASE